MNIDISRCQQIRITHLLHTSFHLGSTCLAEVDLTCPLTLLECYTALLELFSLFNTLSKLMCVCLQSGKDYFLFASSESVLANKEALIRHPHSIHSAYKDKYD